MAVHDENDVTAVVDLLDEGEELGISVPKHLKDKLRAVRRDGTGEIDVALVGGFSEGKTSLVAAWLGEVPSNMRIGQSETTDAVRIYDAGDGIRLIDTPGLFGFKSTSDGPGEAQRYKDLTLRYLSEADLILYAMSPGNPLKESHRDHLNWLFRDLGLLPRTVFVLGRFDQVADLEDDDAYDRHLAVKSKNVRSRLRDLIGLTDEESRNLSIVGVAADPFEEGLDRWLERREEHDSLSRVPALKSTTATKLAELGGSGEVRRATCATILTDVTRNLIAPARRAAQDSEREASLAEMKAQEEAPRLNRHRREAALAQVALLEAVDNLFGDLIVEAKNTGAEGFEEFFDRRIGRDGVALEAAVKAHFIRELGPVGRELVTMGASFAAEQQGGGLASAIMGKATGAASRVKVTNTAVLKARDWVMPTLKFKPYGAIRAARFANGALALVGVVAEGVSFVRQTRREEKFRVARDAIVDELESQRAAILAQIDGPDFLATHFPQISAMEALFEAFAAAFMAAVERHRRTDDWAVRAESLRDRFLIAPGEGRDAGATSA